MRTETRISRRYLHSHVQCSIIHNNQEVNTPECPQADEWRKVCYTGILLMHGNKEILFYATIGLNLWDHHCKWNEQIHHDSIFRRDLR
jgi:hypothetical protein